MFIASSAKECLEFFKNESIELVISDQRMPEISGLELLAKIKTLNPLIPTILLTAYTDHNVLKDAFNKVGIHKYINKPFDTESLKMIMDMAIETYRLNQKNEKILLELKESEVKFKGIFNSILDVFVRVNNNGIIEVISPSIKEFLGYSAEELIGTEEIKLYANTNDRTILRKLIRDQKIYRGLIVMLLTKSGTRKYASISCKTYNDLAGNPIGIESILRDITESKLKEKELRESEEKFRLLAEQSPIRIFKVNDLLKIEYANRPISEGDQMIHRFFPKETQEAVVKLIANVFRKDKEAYFEFEETNLDGEKIWCALNVSPIKENDETVSVLVMINDISEKKKVENMLRGLNEQLEIKVQERTKDLEKTKEDLEKTYLKEKTLNNLKSQFVSIASHQFRTPLTVIKSNIGLLEMQIDHAEPMIQEWLFKVNKRIQTEISRMTDLMDNVLILGNKDAAMIQTDFQMVDILKLINSVIDKFNQIQTDKREMKLNITGRSSLFYLDPDLFQHAFSNLISNAFKYSAKKPSPELTIIFKNRKAIIKIKDYGIGIPNKDKPNIFEPFFRATNVNEIRGTGLGTSIVKQYLDLLGAELIFKSELHKGSEFTIILNEKLHG
ncbi:MAG: hypothetical protein COB17_00220 [Sulfurimonas sp.]|nr:MAG: hypothetical protein COB17_00220 [Sulfurimonas sp.]